MEILHLVVECEGRRSVCVFGNHSVATVASVRDTILMLAVYRASRLRAAQDVPPQTKGLCTGVKVVCIANSQNNHSTDFQYSIT